MRQRWTQSRHRDKSYDMPTNSDDANLRSERARGAAALWLAQLRGSPAQELMVVVPIIQPVRRCLGCRTQIQTLYHEKPYCCMCRAKLAVAGRRR